MKGQQETYLVVCALLKKLWVPSLVIDIVHARHCSKHLQVSTHSNPKKYKYNAHLSDEEFKAQSLKLA